mmetsp:Transcript_10779/g.29771  ORF Transcript_10779/g.29771 Transcript_10779/m.29771 type:complete len:94 (-) Transcript_10779:214-495(-)
MYNKSLGCLLLIWQRGEFDLASNVLISSFNDGVCHTSVCLLEPTTKSTTKPLPTRVDGSGKRMFGYFACSRYFPVYGSEDLIPNSVPWSEVVE